MKTLITLKETANLLNTYSYDEVREYLLNKIGKGDGKLVICLAVRKPKDVRLAEEIFGIDDLLRATRKIEYVKARQLIAWYRRRQGQSLRTISDYLNKDHTSVIYAVKKINEILDTKDSVYYPKVMRFIDEMEE